MFLKFTASGPLEEMVKYLWPEISDSCLIRDYENKYEWVWLTLPEYGVRLNISREHEFGREKRVYPVYVSAFRVETDMWIEEIPEEIIGVFRQGLDCPILIFDGRRNVDKEEGTPIKVLHKDV
ncbi:MAG: hypothetical protein WAS33_27150 [Candidatus Promineifilaceae bacterium]